VLDVGYTCAMSIHFSMTRDLCDVDGDDVTAAAAGDDDDDDDDDETLPTMDAITRYVTALNWSTVADTEATVSSKQQPVAG